MSDNHIDALAEHRRHVLTASTAQLEKERDERIEAFARKFPDLYKSINAAISTSIVREVMRTTKQVVREWRQFEVMAVEPVHYKRKYVWNYENIVSADGSTHDNWTRRPRRDDEQRPFPHHERVVLRDTENGEKWVVMVAHEVAPEVYGIYDERSIIERSMFLQYFENDYNYCSASDAVGDVVILPTINGMPDFPKVTGEAVKRLRDELNGTEAHK